MKAKFTKSTWRKLLTYAVIFLVIFALVDLGYNAIIAGKRTTTMTEVLQHLGVIVVLSALVSAATVFVKSLMTTPKREKLIRKVLTYALVFALIGVAYFLNSTGRLSRHTQNMLVPICINVILAVSLNITVGFLGELTLGHAGFMSVGAYAGCLFSVAMEGTLSPALNLALALLVGGLVAALFGILVGVPVLRLRGDYLAIVTLAFGEIIRSIITNVGFTGGASGLKKIPDYRNSIFLVAAGVVVVVVFVALNLKDSKHGRAIMAIRDNRIAAESTGINLTYYKLLAFVIAAFFAGVAGVLNGHNMHQLRPEWFDYNRSIEILVMVVLGGLGSVTGSIIAAVVMYILPEYLRFLADYRMLIYSIVLIVMMLATSSPILTNLVGRVRILGKIIGKKNDSSQSGKTPQ